MARMTPRTLLPFGSKHNTAAVDQPLLLMSPEQISATRPDSPQTRQINPQRALIHQQQTSLSWQNGSDPGVGARGPVYPETRALSPIVDPSTAAPPYNLPSGSFQPQPNTSPAYNPSSVSYRPQPSNTSSAYNPTSSYKPQPSNTSPAYNPASSYNPPSSNTGPAYRPTSGSHNPQPSNAGPAYNSTSGSYQPNLDRSYSSASRNINTWEGDQDENTSTSDHQVWLPPSYDADRSQNTGKLQRPRGNEQTGRSSPDKPRPKLCVICKKKPQYSKGQTKYSTCGLTCAAELTARGESAKPLCVVCGVRPRHSGYPTCGLTCADKLNPKRHQFDRTDRNANRTHSLDVHSSNRKQDAGVLVAAPTYSSCLMCWRATKATNSVYCNGPNCENQARKRAVMLLEAPRGHEIFTKVSNLFQKTWEHTNAPCPEIQKVFRVVETRTSVSNYERYRDKLRPRGRPFKKDGNEQNRWYGTARECDLGDGDVDELCHSATCGLCVAIRLSFDCAQCREGIHTSTTSSRSDGYSKGTSRSPRKALVLADVAAGNEIELSREEAPRKKVPDYDSVQVVAATSSGRTVLRDDLIVYSKDAIRPLYIVIYG